MGMTSYLPAHPVWIVVGAAKHIPQNKQPLYKYLPSRVFKTHAWLDCKLPRSGMTVRVGVIDSCTASMTSFLERINSATASAPDLAALSDIHWLSVFTSPCLL